MRLRTCLSLEHQQNSLGDHWKIDLLRGKPDELDRLDFNTSASMMSSCQQVIIQTENFFFYPKAAMVLSLAQRYDDNWRRGTRLKITLNNTVENNWTTRSYWQGIHLTKDG